MLKGVRVARYVGGGGGHCLPGHQDDYGTGAWEGRGVLSLPRCQGEGAGTYPLTGCQEGGGSCLAHCRVLSPSSKGGGV